MMATKTSVKDTPVEDEVVEPEVIERDADGYAIDADADTGDDFPLNQYSIRVNGLIVWTSGSDARLVNMVKVNNARGEVTAIGSHTGDRYLDITVNIRNAAGSDLDLVEYRKEQERTAAIEAAASPEAFAKQAELNKTAVKTVVSDTEPADNVEVFEPFDNDEVSEPVSRTEF